MALELPLGVQRYNSINCKVLVRQTDKVHYAKAELCSPEGWEKYMTESL